MRECWSESCDLRPSFDEVTLKLSKMIEGITDQNYYMVVNENQDYYNFVDKTATEKSS